MDAVPDLIHYASDRCILCPSPLLFTDNIAVSGEIVAVIGSNRYLGQTDPFMLLSDKNERQEVSVHWVYPERQTNRLLLRQCPRRGCHHRDHPHLAMCFHHDCYNLLLRHMDFPAQLCRPTMQDIWKLGRSTLWLSVPDSKSAEKHKTSLVSASCSHEILAAFKLNPSSSVSGLYHLFSRLPPELQHMVVAHSWKYPFFSPLVVHHQSRILLQKLKDRRVEQITLNISDPIFVGKITYDNSEYISYLSNKRLSPSDGCVCRNSETFWIRISMDKVGIQSIDFFDKSSQGNIALSDNGLWYKVMRPRDQEAIHQIQCLFDNLFLRNVDISRELLPDSAFDEVREWDTPDPPMIDSRNFYKAFPLSKLRVVKRMRWLPLTQNVRGLVVAYGTFGILALHAWYDNVDCRPIYENQPYYQNILWMFFPMGVMERVSDVWVRQSPDEFHPWPGVTFCTTLGRSHTFGPYIEHFRQQEYHFLCLNDPESIVSGLCYNATDSEYSAVRDVGVVCSLGNKPQSARLSPSHPLVPGGPYRTFNEKWFLSYAPLRGIESIRLCRNAKPDRSCIGLLFQYLDQSCQVVGQWRWDCKIDQVKITDAEPALIYCQNDHAQFRTLAVEIQGSAMNTVSYDDTWEHYPLQGQIIWWFSSSGNYVVFSNMD